MEKKIRNLLIFVFPFLLMIITNHFIKPAVDNNPKQGKLITEKQLPQKCSWACHNNTLYCINHHVKMNRFLLKCSQPFYFGEITLLQMLGSYSLANILILVTFIPIYIWYFLIKIIDTLQEIKEVKNDS
ncbi:MAG: hypothetical protein ACKOX3_02170 [Bacteroidota bacterium]